MSTQHSLKHGGRVVMKRNPKYKPHGTGSYVWLMKKYGFKPTMQGPYQHHEGKIVKRFSDGTTGDLEATDVQNDSSYIAPVTIGDPGQTLHLDFDTGSSDLWCWSTHLPQATQKAGHSHTIFDSSKSSTFKNKQNYTWMIQYGDGSSASGIVGNDNVTVGGITIKGQAIELASKISSSFTQDASDGLLGLAWPIINTVQPQPVATPVENMITQKDIPAKVFTAYLGSWVDANDAGGQSWYTFGHIDEETVAASGSSITYTPIDKITEENGFWKFNCGTYTVNGKSYNFTTGKTIADTGTTLCLVPDDVCKNIYNAIPGSKYDEQQQGYLYPVNTATSDLPIVTFEVGGVQIPIRKEALGFTEVEGTGMYYGGIQSVGNQPFAIFGDVFLKGVYAIFDVGNKQFGVVPRKEQT